MQGQRNFDDFYLPTAYHSPFPNSIINASAEWAREDTGRRGYTKAKKALAG
ncbi:MAG: hypothetical protein LUD17_07755 [Bacteroidales bacterium]|nr:hypothetical protein [Bacteroidales bacterium]